MYILTMVDVYTRWPVLVPMGGEITAKKIAKIIFEKWFWLLGTEMITSALKQLKVDVTSIVSRRQRCTLVPALAHDSQQL